MEKHGKKDDRVILNFSIYKKLIFLKIGVPGVPRFCQNSTENVKIAIETLFNVEKHSEKDGIIILNFSIYKKIFFKK